MGKEQNLTPYKKGHAKVPGSGMPKGYKAINTYVREILQKKPIKKLIKDFDKLGIPFKNNAELLAWKKVLIALSKNGSTALAAIKDIEERQDGKVPNKILGSVNITQKDIAEMSDEELQLFINSQN